MLKAIILGLIGFLVSGMGFSQESEFCTYVRKNPNQQQIITKCFESSEDGQPLPPKNGRAASRWPEDWKEFVEKSIKFINTPNIKISPNEIEEALGGRAVLVSSTARRKVYDLVHLPYTGFSSSTSGQQLIITEDEVLGGTRFTLSFAIDWRKVCIDPYDVAIYFGEKFSAKENRSHFDEARIWPSLYQWGMFDRSETTVFGSPSLWITLPFKDTPILGAGSNECVGRVRVFSFHKWGN